MGDVAGLSPWMRCRRGAAADPWGRGKAGTDSTKGCRPDERSAFAPALARGSAWLGAPSIRPGAAPRGRCAPLRPILREARACRYSLLQSAHCRSRGISSIPLRSDSAAFRQSPMPSWAMPMLSRKKGSVYQYAAASRQRPPVSAIQVRSSYLRAPPASSSGYLPFLRPIAPAAGAHSPPRWGGL